LQLLESIYQNRISLLERFLSEFKSNINAEPYFGIELEFYLLNQDFLPMEDQSKIEKYLLTLDKALTKFSLFKELHKEQGRGQIEVKTHKTNNLKNLGHQLEEIKLVTKNCANSQELNISFLSQPIIDDCGSSLQLNLSLYNNHHNLYSRSQNQKNKILLYSIAGILNLLDSMMIFSAPKSDDYLRFDKKINLSLYQKGKYSAPINKSWGMNNRTSAIRIPDIIPNQNHQQSRLEFRVPAADADIYLNMLCLLISVEHGIKNQLDFATLNLDEDGIYGNAFDPQYNLHNLIASYKIAEEYFFNNQALIQLLRSL
jgi:glutamine synthetase